LIDTHAHLTDPSLLEQLDHILARARSAGVAHILAIATDAASSHACVELAEKHACIGASVGIHPNYCHQARQGDWERVVQASLHPGVRAIGETGLDRYWKDCPWDLQVESLQRHLWLSRQRRLPIILHMRDCEQEMLGALEEDHRHGLIQGVMHSFTGSREAARRCLEMGLHISFAGMVTYKKSGALREVAKAIPSDRILVETDCPYLSPEPVRGHRPNEPALVVHTAQCLADARGQAFEQLAWQTSQNARRLFQFTTLGDLSGPID
jgi:TatD DNase family protein